MKPPKQFDFLFSRRTKGRVGAINNNFGHSFFSWPLRQKPGDIIQHKVTHTHSSRQEEVTQLAGRIIREVSANEIQKIAGRRRIVDAWWYEVCSD